jgi:galactose mutarotase-like enzyme
MIKFINKKTGTNFLLEPQNTGKGYKPAFHGAPFANYDTSGFDECFPTIAPCTIQTKLGSSISFPDHGQLWSKSWNYQISDDETLIRSTKGVNWDYSFTKRVKLEENRFTIYYRVENFEEEPLPYIWAAHPLLNVEPGDEIYLTDEIQNFNLYWSNDNKLGTNGTKLEWPFVNGKDDFSVIPNREFGKSVKLFSKRLNEFGWAALHKVKNRESFLVSFNTDEIPFLGIWLCYGGWPENAKEKHLTIGLEPTNSCCDSLATAIEKNGCGILPAGGKNEWKMEFIITQE